MLKNMLTILTLGAMCVIQPACTQKKSEPVSDSPSEIHTPSGLRILIKQRGSGKAPKKGDMLQVNYTGMLENKDSTIFDSSVMPGREPFVFPLGLGKVIKGWDEAFSHLTEGTKATVVIPSNLAYGDDGIENVIPPKATLIFKLEFLKIVEKMENFNFIIAGKEKIKTKTGLEYVIVESGSGVKTDSGKTVELHYTARFENDSIFDSSLERGLPMKFKLGAQQVIPGFEEGLMNLKQGDKARLLIPFALGYGEAGLPRAGIPAKSNLIFDVQVIKVE